MPTEITDKSQIPSTGLVVIDFYATWCGPCKRVAPLFEELERHYPNVKFLKVNVDEAEELSQEYTIESLPTFIFLKNYQLHSVVEGVNPNTLVSTFRKFTE